MATSVFPEVRCAANSPEAAGLNDWLSAFDSVPAQPTHPVRGILFGLGLGAGMWGGIAYLVMLAVRS